MPTGGQRLTVALDAHQASGQVEDPQADPRLGAQTVSDGRRRVEGIWVGVVELSWDD